MDPVTIILLLFLISLPYLIFLKNKKQRNRISDLIDMIPGPPSYPLIGTNLQFIFTPREDMFVIRRHISKRYAPIFRSWLGKIPAVHLMKASYCEAIMNNSIQITKGPNYNFIRHWLCDGLLTSTGAKWHHRRKLITPTFHFKILDNFVEVFVEKGQELVKQLKSKADGKVFDIYPFITHCALDVICETAMGVTVNAMKKSDSEYIKSIYAISEIALQRLFRPWLHPDFIFYMTNRGRQFKNCLDIVHGFTTKVIKERRETLAGRSTDKNTSEEDELLGKKKRMAFLDLLIEASKNGTVLNDLEIREEVDTFMFEGHDTTTAGICWSLFLLGNHPEIQERAYEELEEIFQGDDRPITMKDLGEMKYLERVVKESLRLYPSVPFITRQLTSDAEIGGYLLPAGCTAILHIIDVHRDPEQYQNPERFDPDRFLTENSKNRHPYAYIPFSAGPRNCIGQKFALYEEKALLASVLRRYKVKSAETQSSIEMLSELILRPANGIKLSLEPRKRQLVK